MIHFFASVALVTLGKRALITIHAAVNAVRLRKIGGLYLVLCGIFVLQACSEQGGSPGQLDAQPDASVTAKTFPTFRVARSTNDLERLLPFYRDGLGLEILFRFEGPDGFDGMMLGAKGAPYHLEFTKPHGYDVGRAPTQENLIVFYLPIRENWTRAVDRMSQAGFDPVPSFNPYWDQKGTTFEDPDGYRLVLQNDSWDQ